MKIKTKTKKTIGTALTCGGLVLIVSAFAIWGYNIWDDNRAGKVSDEVAVQLEEEMNDPDNYYDMDDLYKKYPEVEMPATTVDGTGYIGQIDIADIGISLPVADEWSYEKLKIAPCRYSGSAYLKNMVIAAHNYSRHFGKIKNLQIGSSVVFTDIDKHQFTYKVADVEQLQPTAIEDMVNGDYDLTLFTCTQSGKMRIAVRCDEVEQATAE